MSFQLEYDVDLYSTFIRVQLNSAESPVESKLVGKRIFSTEMRDMTNTHYEQKHNTPPHQTQMGFALFERNPNGLVQRGPTNSSDIAKTND
ncbi:hypothetical protein T265_08270 [Opisthorchis viverrini]|uniref:Uncharacterized protein n=1 Tax=Opisthorchis viverrini TaxID=6198 RepID=A0A074ZKT7_OPIVI|nr:hypothetical protein T265_08270 [Opisthorchis viverrini]KER23975.1 hypothetical protein T265_08270 [Opisthorchis viverrini]